MIRKVLAEGGHKKKKYDSYGSGDKDKDHYGTHDGDDYTSEKKKKKKGKKDKFWSSSASKHHYY